MDSLVVSTGVASRSERIGLVFNVRGTAVIKTMDKLIQTARTASTASVDLPFAVMTSLTAQQISNVPLCKPSLFLVLNGKKVFGNNDITIPEGGYILLASRPTVDIGDIPGKDGHFSILIGFDVQDFNDLLPSSNRRQTTSFLTGDIDDALQTLIQQFIEWSVYVPPVMWPHRRKEILQYMQHAGALDIASLSVTNTIRAKVHKAIVNDLTEPLDITMLCEQLAMSESTLRRKLRAEGTSLQQIKDRVRLGHGLRLIQTSSAQISEISNRCGYQSQSRFTEKFRRLFGATPSELRRSKLAVSGKPW